MISFNPMIPFPVIGVLAVAGMVASIVFALRSRSSLARARWATRVLVVLLCVSLLARPTVAGELREAQATEADVFFVVDTTISVVAEDWGQGQSRLSGIQSDIESLVSQLAGARFALITFDQVASFAVPLTADSASVLSAVEVLRPERSAYAMGSNIGLAHEVLTDRLRSSATQAPERVRLVYYFGDGEQTAASAPESFALASPYVSGGNVLGYGTVEGGPMRDDAGPASALAYIMDSTSGAPALSAASPGNLAQIAGQLGVDFISRDVETPVETGIFHASLLAPDGSVLPGPDKELYWISAVGIFALLLLDVGVLILALTRSGLRSGKR